jgi:hypothetical protein
VLTVYAGVRGFTTTAEAIFSMPQRLRPSLYGEPVAEDNSVVVADEQLVGWVHAPRTSRALLQLEDERPLVRRVDRELAQQEFRN